MLLEVTILSDKSISQNIALLSIGKLFILSGDQKCVLPPACSGSGSGSGLIYCLPRGGGDRNQMF